MFFYVAVRCRLASYSHCTVQPHSSTETRRKPLSLSSLIGAPVTFSAAMFYESSLQYRKIGKSLMRGLFAKVKRQPIRPTVTIADYVGSRIDVLLVSRK